MSDEEDANPYLNDDEIIVEGRLHKIAA